MNIVTYKRVSTRSQMDSTLGIQGQTKAISDYVSRTGATVIGEYTEQESGKTADRKQLVKALRMCRKHKATLVISKLDRLSRDVEFIARLMKSKIEFVALDMPDANSLTVHIMASMAQYERESIGHRTSVALQALKATGKQLGLSNPVRTDAKEVSAMGVAANINAADRFALSMRSKLAALRLEGHVTLAGLTKALNDQGYRTARNTEWYRSTVRNLEQRIARLDAVSV